MLLGVLMAHCPHGLKPILHPVLWLAVLVSTVPCAHAATNEPGAITARSEMVIVGPPGEPFNMPSDAAVGPDGRLYVLDGVNHRVVVCDAEGHIQLQFGGHGSGLGQLAYPLGIAVDPNGTVYVADSGNHRVQTFTALGQPRETIPLLVATAGRPPDPTDVAVDPARRRLYIADNDNHVIHVFDLAGRRFEPVWGSPGQGQRQFRFPFLIDVSTQGYLLVVEPINTRVQMLNRDGKFVGFLGGWGVKPGQLFRPKGVAAYESCVYVTDSYLGNVQVFTLDGRFLGVLTNAAGSPIAFTTPTGITIDAAHHRLYVVELKANRVRRVDLG